MSKLTIDLGCGACKKKGAIGVDKAALPGVDHVVDFERAQLPFADQTVDHVHLSHCMEHISDPVKLFTEISRICKDGARIEMWGPYAWENSAFIYDHKNFFNEDHFYHPCLWFPEFWRDILHARWLLHGFTYVVPENIMRDIQSQGVSLDFAVRYFKGVVKEFCAHIEVRHDDTADCPPLRQHVATSRDGVRYALKATSHHRKAKLPIAMVARRLGLQPVPEGEHF